MDGFFEVFADHATRYGLETAVAKFASRVPDEELNEWVAEYESRQKKVLVGYPPDKMISAPGLKPWYPGPLESGKYWPPFPEYLRKPPHDWPDDRLEQLDEASSKVIAFTKDPSQQSFQTKGLIIGYVQSGKTTNFTAVIAKAADVGYRLVIVLSGIHNGLRKQTQDRLQSQLLDFRGDEWFPLTTSLKDFQRPPGTAAAHFQQNNGPVICVVKKNQRILKKLHAWLAPAARSGKFANIPVLIIDDEADQASVATPKINPLIRDLLRLFPRCTYIGYTATPFANVLIDPRAEDLYPETFILNLPQPEGYFGTERIFGREAVEGEENGPELDGYDMVRLVPADTVDLLRPKGKGADAGFAPSLTDELIDAVRYFWLATAARRCRGDDGHSTMLIHTSMKTTVHESYRGPLEGLQRKAATALANMDEAFAEEMRRLWEKESRTVRAEVFGNRYVPFDRLLAHLRSVVDETSVVLDNYRSRDRLDYSGDRPVVAIAVGGNTLSRGLTLEGLVVSFFVRAATTYDTLLQMGRWFGFRPGYEDLPRIWMTEQLRSWFRHLATVEHEIRLDVARYEEQDLGPKDYGVRIRTHPVLNVTTKMGAARIDYASYGGRRVQTRYFREDDQKWLTANLAAARDLVAEAAKEGAVVEDRGDGEVILRNVDVKHVLSFLDCYQVHEDSPDLDTRLVADYINKENRRRPASLLSWSVAVMGGPIRNNEHAVKLTQELSVGTISRSKLKDTGGDKADIKTLMSKEHRVIDMEIPPAEARRMSEAKLVDLRTDDPTYGTRGLLLLYPIAKDSPPDEANKLTRRPMEASEHVIGMALVFPGNAQDAVENSYVAVDLTDVDQSEYDDVNDALTEDDDDLGQGRP